MAVELVDDNVDLSGAQWCWALSGTLSYWCSAILFGYPAWFHLAIAGASHSAPQEPKDRDDRGEAPEIPAQRGD